jgi:two-component system, NtrC family, nitrogen regulation response regulator NtrX
MTNRVLVIDDEGSIRDALRQVLEYEGWYVKTASSGGEGLNLYSEFRPHVVLLDVKMAGLDGLDTLSRLRDVEPPATVVMISGHATVATAVQATQQGAFDFLEKPLDTDRLLVTLRNALKHSSLAVENRELRRVVDARYAMVGHSPVLEDVRALIARVGPTNARVLILGENGSGKELVARALHDASPRRERAFVEVNCAAIPAELIESELFGHMKGSFTGAFTDRPGKFELADGGTLFLDEVGDMSPSAQSKVLRVLQEGAVTRIGAAKAMEVDVRVLAATNKRLEDEIAAGHFREDLYHRLNVIPIEVPPLRDRLQDIPDLVQHFVESLSQSTGVAPRPLTEEAVRSLQRRLWPGNVRELRNAIERLLILSVGKQITAADVDRLLPPAELTREAPILEPAKAGSLESFREEAERVFLLHKLRENAWNVTETARALDIPRSNLYKKIQKFQLDREST